MYVYPDLPTCHFCCMYVQCHARSDSDCDIQMNSDVVSLYGDSVYVERHCSAVCCLYKLQYKHIKTNPCT